MKISLGSETRFHKDVRLNPGNSVFLGYLYALVIFTSDLGREFAVGMCDLKVRVTTKGDLRIEFPNDVRTDANGNPVDAQGNVVADAKDAKRDDRYHVGREGDGAFSRDVLTGLVAQIPEVGKAHAEAVALRAAAGATKDDVDADADEICATL